MSPLPASSSSGAGTPGALLRQRWAALNERERVVVGALAVLLVVLLVWGVAVRPAWRTLSAAPALRARADAEALQMQAIAAEARELRAIPPVPQTQAEQVLKSATEQLGAKARLQMQGGRATLTLTNATGEDLRQWLVQARGGARARPTDLQLAHGPQGYSGTLVVTYGPQS